MVQMYNNTCMYNRGTFKDNFLDPVPFITTATEESGISFFYIVIAKTLWCEFGYWWKNDDEEVFFYFIVMLLRL